MANEALQRQLDASYAKLAQVQSEGNLLINPLSTPINVAPVISSPPTVESAVDIETMITKIIEERLAALLSSTVPTPEPVKEITILDALGNILTGAELKWLQDEKVISRIPHFVLTNEGQEITKTFFTAFRKEYEK